MKIKKLAIFIFVLLCIIPIIDLKSVAGIDFKYYKIPQRTMEQDLYIGLLPIASVFTTETNTDDIDLNMTADQLQKYLSRRSAVLCQCKRNIFQIYIKINDCDFETWNSFTISDYTNSLTKEFSILGYSYVFFSEYKNEKFSFLKTFFNDVENGRTLTGYCVLIDGNQVEIIMETYAAVKDKSYYDALFKDIIDTLYYGEGCPTTIHKENNENQVGKVENNEEGSSELNHSSSSSGSFVKKYKTSKIYNLFKNKINRVNEKSEIGFASIVCSALIVSAIYLFFDIKFYSFEFGNHLTLGVALFVLFIILGVFVKSDFIRGLFLANCLFLVYDGPLLIVVAPFIEESKLFVLTIFEYALFVAFYIVIFCLA